MKKEAYYFSHDSSARNDEKILALRMDLGWEGYGVYWAIIEMLREANAYEMQTQYKRIAFGLQVPEEMVKSIIESYGLFSINKDVFFSESLNYRMELKEAKSKQAREAALKSWESRRKKKDDGESNADAEQTQNDSNAIKGKESKVKEIKEKDNNIYYYEKNNLKLTHEQYQKLCKDYPITTIDEYLGRVTNWKSKEKVKDLYLTMLYWMRRDNVTKLGEVKEQPKEEKKQPAQWTNDPRSGQFC